MQNWMTRELLTIGPDEPLCEAMRLMNTNRIRRLPVVENERLVGLLTPGDIERAMPAVLDPTASGDDWQLAGQAPVRTMMTSSPLVVSPGDTLEQAAAIMRRHKIGGLPVCQNGRLVGIITETNMLGALVEILGGEMAESVRVDIRLPRSADAMFGLLEIVRDHDLELVAMVQHCNSCRDQRKMTLRFAGERVEELLRELGENGMQITRVLRPGETS